jgi:hypothetical protein
MTEQSAMHVYVTWAKERLDEMDAALASLEVKASQAKADSKVKADEIVAGLKIRRDEFAASVKKQADAGEAAWARTKADLESQWSGFEAQIKTYFDMVGKRLDQQQATFRGMAGAQTKAWHQAGRQAP